MSKNKTKQQQQKTVGEREEPGTVNMKINKITDAMASQSWEGI